MKRKRRSGIGRREVLVVAVLVILIAVVLLPFMSRQRQRARRAQCELHQIRIAQALLHHEMDHGYFPGYSNLQATGADQQAVAASWVFPILPYLTAVPPQLDYAQETARFRRGLLTEESMKANKPYADTYAKYGPEGGDEDRGRTPRRYIAELVCPANLPSKGQPAKNAMSYVANTAMPDAEAPGDLPADWPANGVFMNRYPAPGRTLQRLSLESLKDGADTVMLLSENVDCGQWTDTDEARVGFVWVAQFVDGEPSRGDQLLGINHRTGEGDGSMLFARPSSRHSGGVNVAFASGRTTFLNERIDYLALTRLMMSDKTSIRRPGTRELIDPPYRYVVSR